MRKTKEITPHSKREIAEYMAGGIEQCARECERDGILEKAVRLFAWAAKLRAEADEPDEDETRKNFFD